MTEQFDIKDYQVTGAEEKTLTVDGKELKLTIRTVPWPLMNDFVADAFRVTVEDQAGHFDNGLYQRECLKYMLVEAPWGRTTDTFLLSLKGGTDLVLQLAAMCPDPFAVASNSNLK